MSKSPPHPPRLFELSPDEDPHHLAPLFKHARSAPDEEFPRLRWRLRTSLGHHRARSRRWLRFALIVGGVFVSGGVVGAALRPFWEQANPIGAVTKADPPAKVDHPPMRKRVRPPLSEDPPSSLPLAPAESSVEKAPPVVSPPATRFRPRRLTAQSAPLPISEPAVAPGPPPIAPAPSPVAVEQALLGDILRSLRQERNPRAALTMLDDHARRFPDTGLGPEVTRLRVEALLGLGRDDEALSLLEHAAIEAAPNPIESIVLRGELRAAAGRWPEARMDFETALTKLATGKRDSLSRELNERARWGRASARSHLGDDEGARADLNEYLRLFPAGRFAKPAAKLLEGAP